MVVLINFSHSDTLRINMLNIRHIAVSCFIKIGEQATRLNVHSLTEPVRRQNPKSAVPFWSGWKLVRARRNFPLTAKISITIVPNWICWRKFNEVSELSYSTLDFFMDLHIPNLDLYVYFIRYADAYWKHTIYAFHSVLTSEATLRNYTLLCHSCSLKVE